MSLLFEQRLSDSPFVETITRGRTLREGSSIRPAESHWHMVLVRHSGGVQALVVGPLTTAGMASWGEGAEILWLKFKLGTYMPHMPAASFVNGETVLPQATSRSFWLNGSAWQFPDVENVDTFLNRLVRQDILVRDPIVRAVMQDQPAPVAPRTVRHRFLHTTGLSHNQIHQIERAAKASTLLQQGKSILDTVEALGYFDQPHLTRALKQWVGYTPAQILRDRQPTQATVNDARLLVGT